MAEKLKSLRSVFVDQLKDVCNAEKQLTEALPKMAQAATHPELRTALQEHLALTQRQHERVQSLLDAMGEKGTKKCAAMEGLIKEGDEIAKQPGDDLSRDAGIIAAAQKVEHYEIATYGSLRAWAQTLGENDAMRVLTEILDEEYAADATLNQIAESHLNAAAANVEPTR
jgi:ferritin-like metal-binding protein YciE